MNVPAHEVLAAGFPCQPFSKSGAQRGMDETRGTLYWNILQIIEERKPKVVLLENVRNLAGPRHLHEWQVIIETLRDEGYRVSETPGDLLAAPAAARARRAPAGPRARVHHRDAQPDRRWATACRSSRWRSRATGSTAGDPKQEWHLEDLLDDTPQHPRLRPDRG